MGPIRTSKKLHTGEASIDEVCLKKRRNKLRPGGVFL